MAAIFDLGVNPNVMITFGICVALAFLAAVYRSYLRPRTTKLVGPLSNDFIFGVTKDLFNSSNLGGMYRNWEKTYGPVYEIPSTFGSTILVLQDPGAITHLYSKDTSVYHQSGFVKAFFECIMMVGSFNGSCKAVLSGSFWWQTGDVVVISEGETHKRFILMITFRAMVTFIDVPDNGGLCRVPSRTRQPGMLPPSFLLPDTR